jgi:hypothetical protein
VREGVVAEFGGQRTSGLLMMHLMIRFRRAGRAGLPDVRRALAGHKADRHPSTGLMMSSVHGRGSSGFEDVPVLGAVKIVRPVGRCILTAPPAEIAGGGGTPRCEQPDGHQVICTPTPEHDLDNFIRGVHNEVLSGVRRRRLEMRADLLLRLVSELSETAHVSASHPTRP